MNLTIISIFVSIFLTEGLGLTRQQDIFSLIYIGITVILSLFLMKKKIVFPLIFSIFYLIFLIFSLISSLNFSLDKEVSFSWWLFYISCFLVFVSFYNFKEVGKNIVNKIIIYLTPIFVLLFLLKKNFPQLLFFNKLALSENNLFFDFNSLHNHLGVIIGLFIIFFIWKFVKEKKTKDIILTLILFPFLLISYNRSAILAFLITLIPLTILYLKNKTKTIILMTFLFVAGLSFLMISSGFQIKSIKPYQIQTKGTFGSRELYWKQGVQSFLEKPFFGIGYGNFGYASNKYEQGYSQWIDNAANIFLEILAGGGLLSFLPFVIIIGLIILSALKNKSIYSFLFIFLLIDFQTDFSYRNYSLFILFIILAAITYQEKYNEKVKGLFMGLASILGIILLLIVTSNNLLLNGNYSLAQKLYPLNKKIYPLLIKEKIAIKDYENAKFYNNLFGFIAPINYERLVTAGSLYELQGRKKEALNYYKQICQLNKYCELSWIKKIASLIGELYPKTEVYNYLRDRIEIYRKAGYLSDQLENLIESEIKKTCLDLTDNKECYFLNIQKLKHFYEPKPNAIEHPNAQIPFSLVENKMNKDGLNSTQNFSIKKSTGVFRIIVMGGSETYGLYVKTSDNWPEQLEALLNQKQLCSTIKKFEVINLGVDGYDLSYSVERYKLRGEKYNPDLIMLFVPDLYQLNELLSQKMSLYDRERNGNNAYAQEVVKGNLYPSWTLAMQDIVKEMDYPTVLKQQNKYLNDLYNVYKGPVLLLDYDYLSKNDQEFLQKTLKNQPNSSVFLIHNIYDNKKYLFPDGSLNNKGYTAVAQQLYNEITQGFNVCHVR